MAGELGVRVYQGLLTQAYLEEIDGAVLITASGEVFFESCGIDVSKLRAKKSPLCKPCLDWTERQFHLAGSIGNALLQYLLDNRLVIRSKKPRVLKLTEAGKRWLADEIPHF